jgi:hypothetical protein
MATYTIYPSINIARVGNAPDDFYIGPETYGGLPILPDGALFTQACFRDAEGRLRRQAARFRIFGETPGNAKEVTLDNPDIKEIRWTAHIANKKASWYQFITSQGEFGYAPTHPLRNADKTTQNERQQLIIDAGPRRISGRNQGGPAGRVEFSRSTVPPGYKGSFPPETLKPFSIDALGEVRTDAAGRLLLLGGFGHSGSVAPSPSLPTYANNDGWFDDTSDGPVTATVVLTSGEAIEAAPAWVIVAPPGYAPELPNLVTLYDTIFDISVRFQGARPDIFEHGMWKGGADGYRPSYETEIRPILERGEGYHWVAAVPPKPHSFDYAKLGDPRKELNEFRQFYLDALRKPTDQNVIINPSSGATMMPYLAGDDALGASTVAGSTRATSKFLKLTDTQYFMLQQWAMGFFDAAPRTETHPGHSLTREILGNCVGGAFSPGIEMTWISRNPAFYSEPFRLKAKKDIPNPLSLGSDFTAGLEPGDVSRYMALPWQADFNECSSQPIEGRVLWWWPAQRPEFVRIPRASVGDGATGESAGPMTVQVPWVGTDYDQNGSDYISFADNVEMVMNWDKLGFVYNVGSTSQPNFVEVERTLPRPRTDTER